MKNMYIDFHIIQTVPPSCVNRDDTGSPKTAVYGGTMRARVSSQAWKRAMRLKFKELFTSDLVGYRTKKTAALVADQICSRHPELLRDDAEKMAEVVLELAGVKAGTDKKDALFFISSLQAAKVAELAVEYHNDKTAKKEKDKLFKASLEKALNDRPSVDILLFGRMAASNPSLNYDAAAQVAHSISTHTVSNEYDYFTAVDDCDRKENMGAGHLGTVEFNSATLYRYASVNIKELAENLNVDELKIAVRGFAEALICSMPTGRQNTFANRTLPDLVYVAVREDQPINLAGAFEKPVFAGTDGYVVKSKKALIEHACDVYENYTASPKTSWVVGKDCGNFALKVNIDQLLEEISHEVERYAAGEG